MTLFNFYLTFSNYIYGIFAIVIISNIDKVNILYKYIKHRYMRWKYPSHMINNNTRYVPVYLGNELINIPFKVKMASPSLKYYDENNNDITRIVSPFTRCVIMPPNPIWFNVKSINAVDEKRL